MKREMISDRKTNKARIILARRDYQQKFQRLACRVGQRSDDAGAAGLAARSRGSTAGVFREKIFISLAVAADPKTSISKASQRSTAWRVNIRQLTLRGQGLGQHHTYTRPTLTSCLRVGKRTAAVAFAKHLLSSFLLPTVS